MNAATMPIETPLRGFIREFTQDRVAVIALAMLAIIVLLALLAPWITPQDPYDLSNLVLRDARRPPGYVGSNGFTHWLGTDAQGRDLYSAILYGLRISLQVGLMAGGIAFAIGASLGTLAGFSGGRIETLIMRIIDLQLSFPAILLALVLSALLGQGKWPLIAALVTAQYAYFARTAHGAASSERSKDYVEAALSTPLSSTRVAFRHVLPNCLPPLIVVATVQVASSIALEATLSFLGLGMPVSEPSLGMLIANGFQYMLSGRYWISIYPGIALIVLIVAINLVGDQIRDQLNPRLKR
jgi:peptide/nickel transport system permease protein